MPKPSAGRPFRSSEGRPPSSTDDNSLNHLKRQKSQSSLNTLTNLFSFRNKNSLEDSFSSVDDNNKSTNFASVELNPQLSKHFSDAMKQPFKTSFQRKLVFNFTLLGAFGIIMLMVMSSRHPREAPVVPDMYKHMRAFPVAIYDEAQLVVKKKYVNPENIGESKSKTSIKSATQKIFSADSHTALGLAKTPHRIANNALGNVEPDSIETLVDSLQPLSVIQLYSSPIEVYLQNEFLENLISGDWQHLNIFLGLDHVVNGNEKGVEGMKARGLKLNINSHLATRSKCVHNIRSEKLHGFPIFNDYPSICKVILADWLNFLQHGYEYNGWAFVKAVNDLSCVSLPVENTSGVIFGKNKIMMKNEKNSLDEQTLHYMDTHVFGDIEIFYDNFAAKDNTWYDYIFNANKDEPNTVYEAGVYREKLGSVHLRKFSFRLEGKVTQQKNLTNHRFVLLAGELHEDLREIDKEDAGMMKQSIESVNRKMLVAAFRLRAQPVLLVEKVDNKALESGKMSISKIDGRNALYRVHSVLDLHQSVFTVDMQNIYFDGHEFDIFDLLHTGGFSGSGIYGESKAADVLDLEVPWSRTSHKNVLNTNTITHVPLRRESHPFPISEVNLELEKYERHFPCEVENRMTSFFVTDENGEKSKRNGFNLVLKCKVGFINILKVMQMVNYNSGFDSASPLYENSRVPKIIKALFRGLFRVTLFTKDATEAVSFHVEKFDNFKKAVKFSFSDSPNVFKASPAKHLGVAGQNGDDRNIPSKRLAKFYANDDQTCALNDDQNSDADVSIGNVNEFKNSFRSPATSFEPLPAIPLVPKIESKSIYSNSEPKYTLMLWQPEDEYEIIQENVRSKLLNKEFKETEVLSGAKALHDLIANYSMEALTPKLHEKRDSSDTENNDVDLENNEVKDDDEGRAIHIADDMHEKNKGEAADEDVIDFAEPVVVN